ncbi:MAG: LysR family transcriptional regulator [Robiginitomaculum sp.]|nr:MAG: LysR family transcriptional regulator [Robiginitomaculum sp.]
MNRYEELETFVRVVEASSITAAAHQLHIAKSAVSRRLKELETRLGAQLMIRTTRKLTLTDTGNAFYQRAVRLLADWAETENCVRQDQTNIAGIIRMAVPLSFGVTHLGAAILDFMELHPDIEFDIDFNDRRVDLIAEGMDLAIRIGSLPDSSMIARKIAPISAVICASSDYLRAHGTPQTPEDLQTHLELRYGNKIKGGWSYTGPDGKTGQVDMKHRLRSTSGDFLRDAAIANQGICFLPRFIVYQNLANGKLVELLSDYHFASINAYAIYPHTRHLSTRVRTFVDFLVEQYKGTPYWEV